MRGAGELCRDGQRRLQCVLVKATRGADATERLLLQADRIRASAQLSHMRITELGGALLLCGLRRAAEGVIGGSSGGGTAAGEAEATRAAMAAVRVLE